jgi:hypothetical protein
MTLVASPSQHMCTGLVLNEEPATLAVASAAGFRCFTSPAAFRTYVTREILAVPA